ncbi:hypothetical protein LJC25_00695 [Bacteroidales bacterium OttesenSCG-928-K03]|nr:hypothetical protein [Odoribacter sp. OttesenSCG-928-L07]MDL2242229.1 hypothetical protein [Bacteroidales bacterium OttesenSCG-928-K03]
MKKFKIYFVTLIVSVISITNIYAQTPQYDEQINVVAPYEPSVSDANKINVNPEYVDIKLEKETINYNMSSPSTNLTKHKTFGLDPLDPTRESELAKKHIFYGKFGFGSNVEPLADIYVNSSDNKKVGGGFHIKHNSAWRQMKNVFNNSYSNTDFDLYGKVKFNNQELQLKGFYAHNMFNYYGVTNDGYILQNVIVGKNDVTAKNNTYGGELSLRNIKTKKSDYKISLNYLGFQFNEGFISHSITLPVNFSYYTKLFKKSKKEELNVKLMANYDISTFDIEYFEETYNNYFVSLEPTYSFQLGAFALKLGLNVNTFSEDHHDKKPRITLHPVAEIKTTIVPEAFAFTIGIKGESYRNDMKSLYGMCKYLEPTTNFYHDYLKVRPDLRFVTNVQYNAYGVFDARFGKFINFSAGVNYAKYNSLPVFYSKPTALTLDVFNSIPNVNCFGLTTVDLSKISISADITYEAKEKLMINLQGKYNIIELANTDKILYPFNIPTVEVYALAKYTMSNKKLSFSAQAVLLGGAKDIDATTTFSISDLTNAQTIDLPLVYDLGLSCNYKIKTGIDLWLNLNNLLHYNNKLYIYQLYPEYPANVMLGVTFSL